MTEQQHRATADEWASVKALASVRSGVAYSCIFELLHRIEALEVAAQPTKSNHLEIPDSSLVHRVARAMNGATERQARAAIREVAAWLGEQKGYGYGWAIRLEQEAEQ